MALPAAMKSMKAPAMKAAMKAKKVTKIARGRMAKSMVFKGRKAKTSGGLTKDSLMVNKRGKVVSKLRSAKGKKSFKHIESWVEAVMEARAAFNAKGFVAINGKTLQGKALYAKAKAIRASAQAPLPAPGSSKASRDGLIC
ncbi:unnamed protein product [Effrenium voratum]|uniref:Uncharacterized protein n=1 Tax=Effrenium voratum TaxID=2562239 RepID=A0AA36MXT8_9DINO|nr:unnamed protein product [Effrenium voratum]CAJ1390514.1 unnamed protein product [Effrenium voratum]